MPTNSAFILFCLMCAVFSTENKCEGNSLQLENEKRAEYLKKLEETLWRREQNVEAAEEKLQKEQELFRLELHSGQEKLRVFYLYLMAGCSLEGENDDHRYEEIFEMHQHFQKRVDAAEERFQEEKKKLAAREMKLQQEQEHFRVQNEDLKEQWLFLREKCMSSNNFSFCARPEQNEMNPKEDFFVTPSNQPQNIFADQSSLKVFGDKTKNNKIEKNVKLNYSTRSVKNVFTKKQLFPTEGKRCKRDKTFMEEVDTEKGFVELIGKGTMSMENYINFQTKTGKTSLMIAAEYDNVEVVKFLLKSGVDTQVKDNCGMIALRYGTERCAEIIKSHEENL